MYLYLKIHLRCTDIKKSKCYYIIQGEVLILAWGILTLKINVQINASKDVTFNLDYEKNISTEM